MKILDSDVLIGFLNKDDDARVAIMKALASGEKVRISTISGQEVLFGESGKNLEKAANIMESIGTIEYSWNDMLKTTSVRKNLREKGTPIGIIDEMIAGTCVANNASIVTRNKKHFSKVQGLKVKTW